MPLEASAYSMNGTSPKGKYSFLIRVKATTAPCKFRNGRSSKAESARDDSANSPWYDYGRKTFVVWGREDKPVKLDEAKAYASEKYGIKEWAKTPYGSWMDAEFVKARTKELKQALADAEGVTA